MEFKFDCPHCQQHVIGASEESGLEATCPNCNEPIIVPDVGSEPVEPVTSLANGKEQIPNQEDDPRSAFKEPSAAVASQQPRSWLPVYVVASSTLIVILLGVLIFGRPSSGNQNAQAAGLAEAAALNEAKKMTEELEKQQKAQSEMLERQRIADAQRKVDDERRKADEEKRKAEEEKRRIEEIAQRKAEQERLAKEAKRNAAIARIDGVERQLAAVRQAIQQTESDQEDYSTKVKEYAMDHKLAIAALGLTVGGGAVALDESDKFNNDQKAVAKGAAVLGGLYAITHHEECIEVANTMAKVATIQADYNARIKSSQQKAASLQSQITALKKELE